jgi:LPXTG-site transpeptidase (sortase) family protein
MSKFRIKPRYVLLIAGFLLLGIGLGLGYSPLSSYWHEKHVAQVLTVPFSQAASAGAPHVNPPTQVVSGKPVRIQIPSLSIDLQVIDGQYNAHNKTWTLTKDKAQYATATPLANNAEGNTFIYGHNRKGVFNTLNRIKPGSTATITTDNGHVFTYKFRSAFETNPSDQSLFEYRGAPILTVQTCSGLWYQNRQLFTFDFVNVQ